MREALASLPGRSEQDADELACALKAPLIDEPSSHSAVISADDAKGYGLPVEKADTASEEWCILWSLWTHYYALKCFPAGRTAVYEGLRASNVMVPQNV